MRRLPILPTTCIGKWTLTAGPVAYSTPPCPPVTQCFEPWAIRLLPARSPRVCLLRSESGPADAACRHGQSILQLTGEAIRVVLASLARLNIRLRMVISSVRRPDDCRPHLLNSANPMPKLCPMAPLAGIACITRFDRFPRACDLQAASQFRLSHTVG